MAGGKQRYAGSIKSPLDASARFLDVFVCKDDVETHEANGRRDDLTNQSDFTEHVRRRSSGSLSGLVGFILRVVGQA